MSLLFLEFLLAVLVQPVSVLHFFANYVLEQGQVMMVEALLQV